MGLFGQMSQMYKMKKEADRIKKKLEKMHIEAELEGVTVTISGEQKVVKVVISEDLMDKNKKDKLEDILLKAFNKAAEKAQQVAATEMRDIMGNLGINP